MCRWNKDSRMQKLMRLVKLMMSRQKLKMDLVTVVSLLSSWRRRIVLMINMKRNRRLKKRLCPFCRLTRKWLSKREVRARWWIKPLFREATSWSKKTPWNISLLLSCKTTLVIGCKRLTITIINPLTIIIINPLIIIIIKIDKVV